MEYNLQDKVFKEIPFQTYNYHNYQGRGYDKDHKWGVPSVSCNVFFQADVPLLSNTSSGSVYWNPDTYAENGKWDILIVDIRLTKFIQ